MSPPTRIWRWSRCNPKLVARGIAGVLMGAAVIWPICGEVSRAAQPNLQKSIAVLPFENLSEDKANA
jgi:hypothetical protein